MPDNSGALDFRTFLQSSREKLEMEFNDQDLRAHDLMVVLNRASGTATGLSEAQIHRPRGLSWNAFKVLFILWMMGDLKQHRVSQLAGISRATTSAVVKTLVRSNRIEQVQSETDRRTNVLALTDEGQEVVRTVCLEQNALLGDWSARLTHTEQDILKTLLMKLMSGHD